MGNGRLALVMPTYRFDATARHCIQTLMSMGGGDIDVFIGDNSENPEKWDWLHKVAAKSENCHVFCHEKNIGGKNAPFLLERANNEFIALASDDDFFTPDYYLAGLELLRANEDCSAANGLHIAFNWKKNGLDFSAPRAFPEDCPVTRLAGFSHWGNSLCYSVYRSEATKRLDKYFANKPLWPSYMDQFIAYTLLSAGKYLIDVKRQLFIYNNQNWGEPEFAHENDAKWFMAGGLPRNFIFLNRLCWTADIVHFFNSTYRPEMLTDAQCDAIVDDLFRRMFLQDFSDVLRDHMPEVLKLFAYDLDRISALREVIGTPWRQIDRFLSIFTNILATFNEELAHRYRAFFEDSLLPRYRSGQALDKAV